MTNQMTETLENCGFSVYRVEKNRTLVQVYLEEDADSDDVRDCLTNEFESIFGVSVSEDSPPDSNETMQVVSLRVR